MNALKSIGTLALAILTVTAHAQNYNLQTVAGHSLSQEGVVGTQNFLRYPVGIVTDSLGNIYFSDTQDNRVWKIDTTGKMTTFAGSGVPGFGGDGKLASSAFLNGPTTLAIDGANNLYIVDLANYRIRMVTSQGIISTVAGNGNSTSSGDGGPATSAGMFPDQLASDKSGNLYIRDGFTFKVRKISAATGIVTPFAGNGTAGYTGDGGAATSAELNDITGIAVDPAGNVYIGDYSACVIRKVNTSNVISTAFGVGTKNCGPSGDGGLASAAGMQPNYLTIDPSGTFLTYDETDAGTLRQINLSTGKISTVAGVAGKFSFGGDGGPATSATFDGIDQMAMDSADNIYLCDNGNKRVRKITASTGVVNTIAGTTVADGPATSAFLDHPYGIAFDNQGRLNIADSGSSLVRQFIPSAGTVSSYTPAGFLSDPQGIATDSAGNVYVGSYDWHIYKIPANNGQITAVAGNGTIGFSGDGGSASKASISEVTGIAVDSAGNVYFVDEGNYRVRKIDSSGNISTVAGNGKTAYSGDGTLATASGMVPFDVALDKAGNVYVADPSNNRILKFAPGGNVTTVAGNGTAGVSGDGGPATQATIYSPTGVSLDNAGNLYISMGTLRVVNSNGVIQTIAGTGTIYPFTGDGPAEMENVDVWRTVVDATGNIYISDYANDRIRKLVAVTATTLTVVSGNNQTASAGTAVAQPLVVKVTGSDGNPYAGATVTFTSSSGATFNPASAMTAADGTASTTVTLGATAGPVTVTAAVTGLPTVSFSLTATAAVPLPTIFASGVVSAGLSTPTVQIASPNSILSIFGQNFAPAGTSRKVSGGDLVNGLVPTNLIGVCVLFGTQMAPMFLVTPGQLNVQAPQLAAAGSATVQVITNCGTSNQVMSNTVTVPVQAAAPEFFYAATATSGKNPVAATDGVTMGGVGDPSRLGAGFALGYPGEVVVIYATGLGVSTPPYGPGALPPVATSVSGVTVSIDGTPVPSSAIQYVGVTPLLAGVYQLNLQLPAGLTPGDHTITISVNGASSPAGPYISTGPAPM